MQQKYIDDACTRILKKWLLCFTQLIVSAVFHLKDAFIILDDFTVMFIFIASLLFCFRSVLIRKYMIEIWFQLSTKFQHNEQNL